MPGTNLTRDEARTRSALVAVDSYHIDLDFSAGGDVFRSVTEIRFSSVRAGASTFLDLVAPHVRSITLNGTAIDPAAAYADGRIQLDGLAAENVVRVDADCAYMNTGEGLHRTVDTADGRTYLYTHFEVPDARRLYTSFEQPDLKASFTFTITAPSGWTVMSNSPAPEPAPAPAAAAPGASVWRFTPTPRISTYITAVVAGEYHVVRGTHTTPGGQVVPMSVACRQSLAPHLDAGEVLAITKTGFDYFTEKFGQPYPFEKYDQVFVPEYNIGAMENVALVTFVESYVFRSKATDARYQARAETILHELAHMWFGDLVTMEWWDDLWLKESFATYASMRCLTDATRWANAWTTFANDDKSWGLRQDQLPSTHPIVADIRDLGDVALNFDGITYAKGAAVLKQLVAWVGPEEFDAGVRTYFATHAWGNTTLTDLLAALEKTSGRDLSAWSREWLQTAGPNTLRPAYTTGPDGAFTSFTVVQEAADAYPTLRSHRVAIGLYDLVGGQFQRTRRLELDVVGARTDVTELVGTARPDLVLLNDDDLTFAAIRLDDASLASLRTAGIGAFADSLPRALCWAAAWDMCRHTELSARGYISLVLASAGTESEISVVETLHATLRTAAKSYVGRESRAAVFAEISAAARERMLASEPGSDLQLAWGRLYVHMAAGPAGIAALSGLLDGSEPVDGLAIDTDFRWLVVTALARAGAISEAEIDAEEQRDNTTAGGQFAASARAARPDPDAKAAAWAAVIDRDDLPNWTQEAIIGSARMASGGFAQSTQADLVRPYAPRYFEVVRDVWATRTTEIARNIAAGLYPSYLDDPEIVERTDALLAESDVPIALRRLLNESRAELVRALAAQEFDRATAAAS